VQSVAQNSSSPSLTTPVILQHNYPTTDTVAHFVQTYRPVVRTAHAVFSVRFRHYVLQVSLGPHILGRVGTVFQILHHTYHV
jgi:hypothetical protein